MQENQQYIIVLYLRLLACSTRNWQRVVGNLALTRKCHGPLGVLAKLGTCRGVGSDRIGSVKIVSYLVLVCSLGTDLRHLSAINLSLADKVNVFRHCVCLSVIFICATIENGAADTLSEKRVGMGHLESGFRVWRGLEQFASFIKDSESVDR